MITQVNSLWDGSSIRTLRIYVLFKVHISVISLSAYMRAKFLQLCPTLCNPIKCSPPGSSVHVGASRQKCWSELLSPSPGDLSIPGTEPASLMSPALAGGFFTTSATWEISGNIYWVW